MYEKNAYKYDKTRIQIYDKITYKNTHTNVGKKRIQTRIQI